MEQLCGMGREARGVVATSFESSHDLIRSIKFVFDSAPKSRDRYRGPHTPFSAKNPIIDRLARGGLQKPTKVFVIFRICEKNYVIDDYFDVLLVRQGKLVEECPLLQIWCS